MSPIPEYDPRESAYNEHSCALACMVSAARQHGHNLTQKWLVETYHKAFPGWATQPGILSAADAAKLLKLYVKWEHPDTFKDPIQITEVFHSPGTVAAFIATKKYYEQKEDGSLTITRLDHCLRLLDANDESFEVMDPVRKEKGGAYVREWPWIALTHWEAVVLILKENAPAPLPTVG